MKSFMKKLFRKKEEEDFRVAAISRPAPRPLQDNVVDSIHIKDSTILNRHLTPKLVTPNEIDMATNSSVLAYMSTSQVPAINTYTKLIMDIEARDTRNEYNPITGVFTATESGIYLTSASIQVSSSNNQTNIRTIIALYKNGLLSTIMDEMISSPRQGSENTAIIGKTGQIQLEQGDTIELYIFFTGALTISTNQAATVFRMTKIS